MKGTIVILGCLLAAYAAPLFANEVPLILEETIQLPVATPLCGMWLRRIEWLLLLGSANGGHTEHQRGGIMKQ